MTRSLVLIVLLASLFGAFAGASFAASVEFAPVTESERALTSVPGYPNAPAVVLFKKGKFSTIDPVTGRYFPTVTVTERRKILTAEGAQRYGELILRHGWSQWLLSLEARTVLPDGRIIALPKDATFKRRTSSAKSTFATAIAFSAVEVGAILDYRYTLLLRGSSFLEPWYFQEEVPTVFSEVTYEIPVTIYVDAWVQDPMKTGIQHDSKLDGEVSRTMAWGNNLPPIPEEPYSVPAADQASRFMLLPVGFRKRDLYKDWASTCDQLSDFYKHTLEKSRNAESKAQEIARAVPGGGQLDRSRALFRFVRDEIETADSWGVFVSGDSNVDSILAAHRGTVAEKALLLHSLLPAAGIASRTVWVANRQDGLVDITISTPFGSTG
jgi:transglutaminase-like putative cysteine protease